LAPPFTPIKPPTGHLARPPKQLVPRSRTPLTLVGTAAPTPWVPRIAIAHDYLTQQGGAEKVVLSMARAFPDSPIYTTLFNPETTFPEYRDLDIRVSPLNKVGLLRRNHRLALPFLPFAAHLMDIDADIVLASSSGWAHGFSTVGRKIVYCYSPARWLYQQETYLGTHANPLKRAATSLLSPALRRWDRRAARSCDKYLAISTAVQGRIQQTYFRDSSVVPAPFGWSADADTSPIKQAQTWLVGRPYHLCISRLLPYKNVDKVIAAFALSGRPLIVVGRGPEYARLQRQCPENVLMLSDLSEGEMRWLYANSEGIVSASREDYGLTPLEAGCYGKPSAVLRWGGFLDTIEEDVTGVYFDAPEPELIRQAVDKLCAMTWDSTGIQQHVDKYSEGEFIKTLQLHVREIAEAGPGPR
jgi:glycosyltransferase involved in cell wall biosynthesis